MVLQAIRWTFHDKSLLFSSKLSRKRARAAPESQFRLRFCVAYEASGQRIYGAEKVREVLKTVVGQSDEEMMPRAFCQGLFRVMFISLHMFAPKTVKKEHGNL